MKVDLVMWTRNGERTLNAVLRQVNKVVPRIIVNQKLIVDDDSKDSTRSIARLNGWRVIKNEGKGISSGANTALKHVETEYFCSFEQDLFLASDWWCKVSSLIIGKEGVAAASGVRFLPQDNPCQGIDRYLAASHRDFGKTLDNTIWKTAILRGIGGFPKMSNAFSETVLHCQLERLGFDWRVDRTVESLHLHSGLLCELRHYHFYGLNNAEIRDKAPLDRGVYRRVLKSPLSAARMAWKVKDPRLIVSYPLCRLFWLRGCLGAS